MNFKTADLLSYHSFLLICLRAHFFVIIFYFYCAFTKIIRLSLPEPMNYAGNP